MAAEMPKIEHTVAAGDNLWKIIEGKLQSQGLFEGLREGQQTHMIDALKDRFAEMPPEQLKAIGISSGNIDQLRVGDNLDLTRVLGDAQSLPDALYNAETLSDSAASSIEANNDAIAAWAAEHPGEQLTDEKINEILSEQGAEHADAAGQAQEGIQPEMPAGEDYTEAARAAEVAAQHDLNALYGSEGFLGTEGAHSIDWLDIKDRTVAEVMEKSKFGSEDFMGYDADDGTGPVGFDSKEVVEKTQHYLAGLIEATGIEPKGDETVGEFIRRAYAADFLHDKFPHIDTGSELFDVHPAEDAGEGAKAPPATPEQGGGQPEAKETPPKPTMKFGEADVPYSVVREITADNARDMRLMYPGDPDLPHLGEGVGSRQWEFIQDANAQKVLNNPQEIINSSGGASGIEQSAVPPMHEYLKRLSEQSGIAPAQGESVGDFMERAKLAERGYDM